MNLTVSSHITKIFGKFLNENMTQLVEMFKNKRTKSPICTKYNCFIF